MKFLLVASATLLALAGTSSAMADVGKTRDQVKAELLEAVRTGDIVGSDHSALKLNQLYPQHYPAVAAEATKSRTEIKAELAEAVRTGDLVTGEDLHKQNERRPDLYPAVQKTAGKSVSQVKTETAEASRTGYALARDSR
jgi:Skp family chaperone for outer membrane proteins